MLFLVRTELTEDLLKAQRIALEKKQYMELKKKSTDNIFSNTTKDAFLLVPRAAFPLK